MNGTSESASVVVTLGPEQPTHSKSFPKCSPGMSRGKFLGDSRRLQETESSPQGVDSCMTARKETQSTLKRISLLQCLYCVKQRAKGLKREGQLWSWSPSQWRYKSVDVWRQSYSHTMSDCVTQRL